MADNTINNNQAITQALGGQASAKTQQEAKKKDSLGEQEFLMLLVNQLQNQDPLNPMDSQQFAAQLAQFSSLEQLISINEKLGSNAQAGSVASYLGQEVVMSEGQVNIIGGQGENLLFDMPKGAQSARVDFLDESGKVASFLEIDNVEEGRHVLPLKNLSGLNGTYSPRVVVVDEQGKFKELDAKVTGTVEGFVLEPKPALIVNGEEVALEEVKEVFAGKSTI